MDKNDVISELISFVGKLNMKPTFVGKTSEGKLKISIEFNQQLFDNRANISTTIDGREFKLIGRLAGDTYTDTQQAIVDGEIQSTKVTKTVNSSYLRLVETNEFDFASELNKNL
tara:strand:- start:235 stop:576 length:342 start_codon:yes stop_codon:yes gene_type:complete